VTDDEKEPAGDREPTVIHLRGLSYWDCERSSKNTSRLEAELPIDANMPLSRRSPAFPVAGLLDRDRT
jgi:hypothetical protein